MVRGGSEGRYVPMGIWAAVSCTMMHACKPWSLSNSDRDAWCGNEGHVRGRDPALRCGLRPRQAVCSHADSCRQVVGK